MHLEKKDTVMVATLLIATFLAVLNQMLATSALPAIMVHFDIDATLAQWLTSGYLLVYAAVIPSSAYLINRFSTRALFFGAYSFLLVGSAIAALAPSFGVLLAGRMLQAVCVGVLTPLVMTIVMLVFPFERRGFAMGMANLVIGIAPAAGPLFAGLFVDTLGWRAMFVFMAAASIVVMAVAFFSLSNFGEKRTVKLDAPSVALSAIGLAALLMGFSEAGQGSVMPAAALLAAGACALAVFAKRQFRMDEPFLDLRVLGIHAFRSSTVAIMVLQALFMAASTLVPLLVQTGLGYSATASGLVVFPGALAGALLSLVAGKLHDSLGVRAPSMAGTVLFVAGFAGLATLPSSSLVFAGACMAAISCGSVLAFTPLLTWGINEIGSAKVAHGNALTNAARQAASSLGTALFVSFMAAGTSLLGTPETVSGAPSAAAVVGLQFAFGIACIGAAIVLAYVAANTRKKKAAAASAKAAIQ